MNDDFTDEELDGAKAIEQAETRQGRSATQILASLESRRPEVERLSTASAQLRRLQLDDIYELLLRAIGEDEEAQEAFGKHGSRGFDEVGAELLNGLIRRHTGLSKQRACCLAKVLRYAIYSRITRAEFPEWLGAKDNLDKVASEYASIVNGEDGEDMELKAKIGDGWERLIATFRRARESGRAVRLRARLRCSPDGKVHFLKKLPVRNK